MQSQPWSKHLAMRMQLTALAVLLVSALTFGQKVNASLTGTVTDPTGATIPDASLSATDTATSIVTKTTSDTTGAYNFPSLHPGTYTLTAEKAGFKSTVLTGITLLVDQKAVIDVQLQVGAISTSVEVSGAAPLVETSTASVGTVIGERDVVDLPLNLRRFGSLATLVPGTTTDNGGFANNQFGSPFSESSYAANGARTSSNNTLIDGVDARNMTFGGFSVSPPPDAVQEFKVQTNIYDAAFGKTAGSTINLVTKSGTNNFHGNAYEFLRNDVFDARNFFATNIPEYRRNQFGGTFGGPIRKNKLFFFLNYEGLRQRQGQSATQLIPTPTQLGGNLSGVLTGKTVNLCGAGGPASLNYDSGQLFYPSTEKLFTCPSGALAGSSIVVGNPIPGNMISPSLFDPVAVKALSYNPFPAPNRAGVPNFVLNTPSPLTQDQGSVRIDYTIGPRDNLTGHYIIGNSFAVNPYSGYSILPGFGDTIYFRGQNVALGWTHTFGAHLLNEAHFGFQRDYDIANCASCPRAPGFQEGFGIKNFTAVAPSFEGFPIFGFNNFGFIGDSNYRPVISPDMVEKYQDNLTWTHGRHTVVAGTDLQFYQILSEAASYSPHGQIYFNGQYSSLFTATPDSSGVSDLADFLLGYPDNAAHTIRYTNTNQTGGGFFNFYGQDDFKATPNLTINLGLRWEYRRWATDKRDNYVTFVPTGLAFSGPGDGLLVTALPNAQNDALCANNSYLVSASGECLIASSAKRASLGFTGRTARTLIYPDHKNFAPRLGISWRPRGSDKMIIRTGYGIFYDTPNFNNQHFVNNNPVFSPSQIFNTAAQQPPTATTANVFAGSGGIPTLAQQYISLYVSPNYKAPYVQQWSFGIESQFATNWALDVNYIGTKGTHLGTLHLFANQAEPGTGTIQPRRPYPDFNQMLFTSPDSNSTYNALQTKVTKRFSNGFSLLAAWTFAKSIDDNEGDEGFGGGIGNGNPQDDNRRWLDRARAVNDARNRFVISYIWELPVGKGKHFLDTGGVANAVLGGWQISGITQVQSGFPFTVTSTDFSNSGSTNPRPDRTCFGNGSKTVNEWFNTSCFTTAALQADLSAGTPRFGDSGRNILSGPAYRNWDFAMLKNFPLSERMNLEFRFEMYNMWNYVNFGSNNGNYSGIGHNANSPATFGVLQSAGSPRDIQFGLKLSF
jgi:hypothetical protein